METTGLRLDVPLWEQSTQELRVSDAISEADAMWLRGIDPEAAEAQYLESAASAVRCIRLALLTADLNSPRRILDMGCGHGRVLRAIRAAYPEAELAACDIVRDAVDFCAEHFDALPVYSTPDISQVELPGKFDLIWSGSLVTHLPDWTPVFRTLSDALSAGGVMVMTTIGHPAASRLRAGRINYGLSDDAVGQLLAGFDRDGFAFVGSEGVRSAGIEGPYGMALASPAWICRFVEQFPLRMVGFLEHGWHDHLDVIALQRLAD
jgi:SAM-dependent methyltransferase